MVDFFEKSPVFLDFQLNSTFFSEGSSFVFCRFPRRSRAVSPGFRTRAPFEKGDKDNLTGSLLFNEDGPEPFSRDRPARLGQRASIVRPRETTSPDTEKTFCRILSFIDLPSKAAASSFFTRCSRFVSAPKRRKHELKPVFFRAEACFLGREGV